MTKFHPFYDNDGHAIAISHAGDTSSGAKPGSLAAYASAREVGFKYFQVDVIKVGSELVSHHAVWGRRIAWEDRSVEGLLSAGHKPDRVSDIVDAIPDGHWNIEVKNRKAEPALMDFLRSQPERNTRFSVSAPFHGRLLKRLRAEFGDGFCTNASLLEGSFLGVPLIPLRNQQADARQVVFPFVRSRRIVESSRAKGIQFQAWPVNDRKAMERMLDLGVGGIITDEHVMLRDLLMERGEWVS